TPILPPWLSGFPVPPAVCRSFCESSIVQFVYGHNQTKLTLKRHNIGAMQLVGPPGAAGEGAQRLAGIPAGLDAVAAAAPPRLLQERSGDAFHWQHVLG